MSKRILIVDDDPSSRKLIQSYLESDDFEVIALADGVQVPDAAKRYGPDAIIMDLNMPQVGGSEAVALMQEDKELKGIPILFLTAVGSSDGLEEGRFDIQVGASTYATLIKPVDAKTLLKALKKLI